MLIVGRKGASSLPSSKHVLLSFFLFPADRHLPRGKTSHLPPSFSFADPYAIMNPWPPSSSSSSFHPSSAAPSSPGYHPHPHPHPPRPPPVASSSSHHGHHQAYVPPPTSLNSVDIADIKETFQDLAIAAPNVCKWIPPPLRGIDDTAESTACLEMRQQHPGDPCGRTLASGIILNDVSRDFLSRAEEGGREEEVLSSRGSSSFLPLSPSSFSSFKPSQDLYFLPSLSTSTSQLTSTLSKESGSIEFVLQLPSTVSSRSLVVADFPFSLSSNLDQLPPSEAEIQTKDIRVPLGRLSSSTLYFQRRSRSPRNRASRPSSSSLSLPQ